MPPSCFPLAPAENKLGANSSLKQQRTPHAWFANSDSFLMRISSRWNTALGISGLNTCWKPTEQDDPMAWEKLGKLHVRIFCFCTALENEMPDPASPSWAQQQCGFGGRKQHSIKWIFSRLLISCPGPQEPKHCMPALPTGPWAFPGLTVCAWLGSVFTEWSTPQKVDFKVK